MCTTYINSILHYKGRKLRFIKKTINEEKNSTVVTLVYAAGKRLVLEISFDCYRLLDRAEAEKFIDEKVVDIFID